MNNYHIMHIHFLSVIATLYFRAHFLQIGKEELIGSFLLPFTPMLSYLHGGKQTNKQSFVFCTTLYSLLFKKYHLKPIPFTVQLLPLATAICCFGWSWFSWREKQQPKRCLQEETNSVYWHFNLLFFFGRGSIYKSFFKTIYTRSLNISLREGPEAPSGTI